MGYVCRLELKVLNQPELGNDYTQDILKEVKEEFSYLFNDFFTTYTDNKYTHLCGEDKWTFHEEEKLTQFSKKHPNAIFELEGAGEQTGHLWRSRFKNGVSEDSVPEIIFSFKEIIWEG